MWYSSGTNDFYDTAQAQEKVPNVPALESMEKIIIRDFVNCS